MVRGGVVFVVDHRAVITLDKCGDVRLELRKLGIKFAKYIDVIFFVRIVRFKFLQLRRKLETKLGFNDDSHSTLPLKRLNQVYFEGLNGTRASIYLIKAGFHQVVVAMAGCKSL